MVILCQDRWQVFTNGHRLSGTKQLKSDFLSSRVCRMMMMTMMMANALIMTMLMMSIEHQQLLPGEIINNQGPISQVFKGIKHIIDMRARQ